MKKGLIALGLSALLFFTSCDSKILKSQKFNKEESIEIRENPKETNLIAIYEDDYCFSDFKKRCEDIKDSLESSYNKKVNFEIYDTSKKIFFPLNKEKKKIKYKKTIDNKLTEFAKKYGKIDKAILGFHSNSKQLAISNDYENPKNSGKNHTQTLNVKEIREIAQENKNAKNIFQKDSELFYLGCSGARGDNSIVETFFNEYNIGKAIGYTHANTGDVFFKEGEIRLKSKGFVENPKEKGFLYKTSENDTIYYGFSRPIAWNITKDSPEINMPLESKRIIQNIPKRKNESTEEDYFPIKKNFNKNGYEILEWDVPLESLYKTRIFSKNN